MLRADNLKRELGVASAAALVISSMIGTGIFTTTGFLGMSFVVRRNGEAECSGGEAGIRRNSRQTTQFD